MKKIFMVASLAAGIALVTSCSVKLTENEKSLDYNNTIHRGMSTHNFIVLDNKLDKVIKELSKQNEELSKQNEEILKILNNQ